MLHSLLQKVIRHDLQDAYQGYLFRALHALHDIPKDGDLEDETVRRHLDPYLPHFESAVASATEVKGVDETCLYGLLERMWSYYYEDDQYKNALRIAKIYLPDCNAQDLPPLKKAKGLRFVAESLWQLGEESEGLRLLRLELEIRKELLGEMRAENAECYYNLGVA